jgi:TadE-like protein
VTDDDGSAVVDFALVGGLLSLLFLSVVQLGLVVHVRNTLIDCAAQGARYGARAGRAPSDGIARTRQLVALELSAGYEARLSEVTADVVERSGVAAVEVRLRAPLPLVGLVGPAGELSVAGHAFAEQPATRLPPP